MTSLRSIFDTYIKSVKTPNFNESANLFDSATTFFSTPGMLDCFGFSSHMRPMITDIHNTLFSKTNQFMHDLVGISSHGFTPEAFSIDVFNNTSFFTPELLQNSSLNVVSKALATDIEAISLYKLSDVYEMADALPQYRTLLEDFEYHCIVDESSMSEALSTPDTKLYYPEPFIASPSFVHEDLWFIHILHYQYWLWFFFISLIMFYFITFINVVRWCNMRTRPRRETRGVSRSKCADLITATVPVTWAASIIISESVDATDYYDGFGSGEIVIGIRAYQWGWEYFYPRGIDLNYNVKSSYSAMVGNSLKYTNAGAKTLHANSMWKYYQNKPTSKLTSTPAHLLLSPSDNSKVLNFMNFNDLGTSALKDANAFKKIQYFSKTNPQSLFGNTSDFQTKYTKVANLYLTDFAPNNTSSYGTFRQHNYTSAAATTNMGVTLLDPTALNKYLDYNLGVEGTTSAELPSTSHGLSPRQTELATENNAYLVSGLTNVASPYTKGLSRLSAHPEVTSFIDSESDAKSTHDPLKYLLNAKWNKKKFINNTGNAGLSDTNDIALLTPSVMSNSRFFNESLSYRFTDMKSSAQQLLTSDRNSRLLDTLNPTTTMLNFTDKGNNLNSLIYKSTHNSLGNTAYKFSNANAVNWSDLSSLARLTGGSSAFTASHAPQLSQNSSSYPLGYDRYEKGGDDMTPTMLKSKEESAPNYIFNSYWLNYWAHTNYSTNISNNLSISQLFNDLYLPTFTEYAEYDFRNWQALELLEDAFWESTYSSFQHEDYLNILQGTKDHLFFKKQEELYNVSTRHKTFKSSCLAKPLFRDLSATTNLNSLPIFSEDAVTNSTLLGLKNFYPFSAETTLDSTEDSYENFKYLHHLNHLSYKNVLNASSAKIYPLSYTQVIDPFRPDYDEASWFNESEAADTLEYTNDVEHSSASTSRLSNPLKLRSTARNSIVTYNAIQKVFKSRLDEGRSNARLQDFSNSYVTHPFVTETKTPYESLLGKNKSSFFAINNYKQSIVPYFNHNYSIWNSLNVYFADLPFLLSMKSDPSRYLWFDWQSRWSSIEIQPSSVARYSLSGVPYTNKSFEYSTQTGDELNDSENYLVRLARARKNYMSNWARTPYFYSRVSNWYKTSLTTDAMFNSSNLLNTRVSLKSSAKYWNTYSLGEFTSSVATPSYSGVSTSARASWQPSSGISSFYYSSSILVDLLSKREYLYREYFTNKGVAANLPKYLTAAPNNPLLEEVKAAYPFIDPVTFSTDVSRELFYQNTNVLKFLVLKDSLVTLSNMISKSPLNLSSTTSPLFYYFFGVDHADNRFGQNLDLYKSQYRPMKKGVTNMVRLHATGAIAMPIEIRLHILASSKDVIHSWAIPSAGIKIDCVPGYSSHRITIFLVSGIFWGQCMEICGRFHHWMPIVVYFMKRDLFFLWCTHFMHYSSIDNVFNMTEKQLTDCVRLASYDKATWVHEINKLI